MRFGESFGEACRYCGSTEIIVSPPSSAGNCAVCSDEVLAWTARREQLTARRGELAHLAFRDALAARNAAERARRWAARRAAVEECAVAAWSALTQSGFKPLPRDAANPARNPAQSYY
jgi:hypothetical protein